MNIYIKTFITSLVLTVILFIVFIPYFRDQRLGQMVREEGPKQHHTKQGTPTMGGALIILGSILAFLMVIIINGFFNYYYMFLLIFPSVIYTIIGFLDDYLIIKRKSNAGISPSVKLFLQIISAAIYFYFFLKLNNSTTISFFRKEIDFKWFYGVIILLMFTGSANAVNLTDGIDGLAGGLVIICLLAFAALAFYFNKRIVFIYSLSLIGSLVAFLCFNINPAKIFMGDAGSLALGVSLANIAIFLKVELLLIIIGFVFIIETLSVILQVIYFKWTKGRRIFLMSPLHHHFELKGFSEWQIVLMFWFFGLLCAFLGIVLGCIYY